MPTTAQVQRETAKAYEDRILFLLTDRDFKSGIVPNLMLEADPFINPEMNLVAETKFNIAWPDREKLIRPQLQAYLKSLSELFDYIVNKPSNGTIEYVLAPSDRGDDGMTFAVYRLKDRSNPSIGYVPMPPHNLW